MYMIVVVYKEVLFYFFTLYQKILHPHATVMITRKRAMGKLTVNWN